MRTTAIWIGGLAALLLSATPAWAPFHLLVIDEIFFGTEECPDAQYVVLRTTAFGMTLVRNQEFDTQLADGTVSADFGKFDKNLPNSQSGVSMIVGTQRAQQLFGIQLDTVVTGQLIFPDGRLCFGRFGPPVGPVDCVAYGNYTGDNGPYGDPATAPMLGKALARVSNTLDNRTDFALEDPQPRNNAGDLGTLGDCASAPSCVGDCNVDDQVTVDEVISGVNIALGQGELASCTAMDGDMSGTVTVDEILSAVNSALVGCA
jgi:hypothetical protein